MNTYKSIMKKIRLLSLILGVILIFSCQQAVKHPITDNLNDTTINDNYEPTGFGQLYFKSNPSTAWHLSGVVRTENGNIICESINDSIAYASCAISHKIDFQNSSQVTFLWKGFVVGNAGIKFYIADDTTRWQELPYRSVSYYWNAADFVPLNNWLAPIFFKFEFTLLRNSRAVIYEVRGYGKP